MRAIRWNKLLLATAMFASLFVTSISGMVGTAFAAASITWVGTAGDGKFSTASNWVGGVAPDDGDSIVFSNSALSATLVVDDDISGLSLAGITLQGSTAYGVTISGLALSVGGTVAVTSTNGGSIVINNSSLTLSADTVIGYDVDFSMVKFPANTDLNGHTLTLSDNNSRSCSSAIIMGLTGSGSLVNHSSYLYINGANTSFSGSIASDAGNLIASGSSGLGNVSGSTTISGSGTLSLTTSDDMTVSEPITLGGSGAIVAADGVSSGCAGGGSGEITTRTVNLSGPVTLNSDFKFAGTHNIVISGTYTSNGHSFSVVSGSLGTITTPQGTVETKAQSTTVTDNQPDKYETISNKQTLILDGTRGDLSVEKGGVLKGIGTAKTLYANSGSIVAPGHSPGKLTITDQLTLTAGSTYEAEILNKDTYDQIVVGSASITSGNAVDVTDSILAAKIYKGFKINATDKFTIIDNKTTTAVAGTFKSLPEGATFKVSDGVFKITYKGGDGNDVVLSVISVPTVPDTGFGISTINPIVTLLAALLAATGMFFIATRLRVAQAKSRS